MKPIYIPSKGRAGQSKTIASLISEKINFIVFVEPQDAEAYATAYPKTKLKVLDENDKGISYVRQAMLDNARKTKTDWFWMIDDDITQTFFVDPVQKKCTKCTFQKAMSRAEEKICVSSAAMGGLEYQQFAWSQQKPFVINSYCEVFVLINVERTRKVNYRMGCEGKEDRDFVLQLLSIGHKSMRTSWVAFSAPKNGSNKGGLHEAYASGFENHWSQKMVELWPGVCTHHVKKDGRPDVKINWKIFK